MVGQPNFLKEANLEISSDIEQLESPVGEPHLRFYVPSGDEFALPATSIREVMQQSPDRITPIPNASPLLLGTINLRGQVIWVADLGQFLGETAVLNTERPEIPVIAIEGDESILGLAIEGLGEMDWRDPQQLQKIGTNISDKMKPFVQGEWVLSDHKFLRLLDQVAILREARWDGWYLKSQ